MNDEKTNEVLEDILKWQKLQGREILKAKLKNENLLSNEKEVHVYYHSDGDKSSRDIGRIVNMSYKTVQNLWKRWINSSLAEPTQKYGGGRCKRLFNLNDLGLELTKNKSNGKEDDK